MELTLGAVRGKLAKPQDHASEAALVDRCRRQDVEAFGRFVDLYQSRVMGFVRRMSPDPDEAADITQEVFIRAFQSFNRFDGRCSAKTWLFRIAHNLCIDHSRRRDRHVTEVTLTDPVSGQDTYDVADDRWEPERLIMNAELVEVIEKGMRQMSEKLRSVLLLHDREDMAYDEIADTLGIPVGTVKSRLFLARGHLQSVLRQYLSNEGMREGARE
jgi:RNA polymerase sigma-70 factor, ECF subfamily